MPRSQHSEKDPPRRRARTKAARARGIVLIVSSLMLVSLALGAHISFASTTQDVTTTTSTNTSTTQANLLVGCGSLLSSCYPLQSSVVQWSVTFGSSAKTSYFGMELQAKGSNLAVLPKSVQVSAWMTYNGTEYWSNTYTLSYILLQTSASTSFHVPFAGGGEYVFYATFTSSGKVVAQQIVDPKIEPEFCG
jgi:hypothetical protein